MPDITLTISPEQGVYLLESLTWSAQAAERSLNRREDSATREKWESLDDMLAQLQAAKRDCWYGKGGGQ
jgi:hypothetical protein